MAPNSREGHVHVPTLILTRLSRLKRLAKAVAKHRVRGSTFLTRQRSPGMNPPLMHSQVLVLATWYLTVLRTSAFQQATVQETQSQDKLI